MSLKSVAALGVPGSISAEPYHSKKEDANGEENFSCFRNNTENQRYFERTKTQPWESNATIKGKGSTAGSERTRARTLRRQKNRPAGVMLEDNRNGLDRFELLCLLLAH